MLSVVVNLTPVIVTEVPTAGPEVGESDEIIGGWVADVVTVSVKVVVLITPPAVPVTVMV